MFDHYFLKKLGISELMTETPLRTVLYIVQTAFISI